jgi:carbon monoxide dehydrogenase subunit G
VVLAIPAAAIILASSKAVTLPSLSWWLAALACLLLGAFLVQLSLRMGRVLKTVQLDERLVRAHLTILLWGAALIADGFVFSLALASPGLGLLMCAVAGGWIVVWCLPTLRKVSISSSYVVNRSQDAVFAFLSDSRNTPSYQPDVESVEMVLSGPIGPGTRFRYRVRLGRSFAVGEEEVVDYEPSRRVTTRVAGALDPNLSELTLEPMDGGTRVTNRFTTEKSIASALVGGYFRQAATTRKLLDRRVAGEARIKQILESAPL